MIDFYHQIKTSIGFGCRCRLNPKFLIQPKKTLSIKLKLEPTLLSCDFNFSFLTYKYFNSKDKSLITLEMYTYRM